MHIISPGLVRADRDRLAAVSRPSRYLSALRPVSDHVPGPP
ncbi:hypothetical protein BZL30_3301 [Mycobacterium kansasii]|uniref:Uncharacterized protein n=1 Tax=Mycobacterium kansasii TaxID=1768 RepID=A0A1V3X8Q2_MYCKA|nr:hypothetical protein BZL30_3301 [Mycobacterium kansasii]